MQHRERVAGAVAERQHHVVGGELFAAGERQPSNVAGLDQHIGHALPEAHLAAERFDLGAHLLDHADEPEGADVRLAHVEDFFRRTGLHELGEHLAREVARVADLAPEFAVGEGAGAALAELHVRFGLQFAAAPQAPGVLRALAHRLATLQHDRPQAHLREHQRGEDAARPEAHHHRARSGRGRKVSRRMADEVVAGVGRGADARVGGVRLQHRGFVVEVAIDGVGQHDRALLARVDTALEDRERGQCVRRHRQARDDRGAQGVFGVVERQAQLGDAEHEASRNLRCAAGPSAAPASAPAAATRCSGRPPCAHSDKSAAGR